MTSVTKMLSLSTVTAEEGTVQLTVDVKSTREQQKIKVIQVISFSEAVMKVPK